MVFKGSCECQCIWNLLSGSYFVSLNCLSYDFLADRTNGRTYATMLRLSSSSSVCDVMYCG